VFSYVKNFDESVDEAKLHELFSKYGKIKSVAVKKSPPNGPPGKAYGFVDFEAGYFTAPFLVPLQLVASEPQTPLFRITMTR
jgi:hypothetical protein